LETTEARRVWLAGISFSEYCSNVSDIDAYAHRLRPVIDGGWICGLAAISARLGNPADFMSVQTVGGLATSVHGRDSSRFVGYLDFKPNSAKREPSNIPLARPETLRAWATEQIDLLTGSSPLEWCAVTCSLCDLGLDPLNIAHALIVVDRKPLPLPLKEVLGVARLRGLAIVKSGIMEHVETYNTEVAFGTYPTFRPVRNSKFLSLERADGVPKDETSFIGCLARYAAKEQSRLLFREERNVARTQFWGPVHALILTVEDALEPS